MLPYLIDATRLTQPEFLVKLVTVRVLGKREQLREDVRHRRVGEDLSLSLTWDEAWFEMKT